MMRAALSSTDRIPIRRVQVANFLSLQNVDVSLGRLNVLVGPNGGGKSNFLSVFRFLGEVARTDLAPAIQVMFGSLDQVVSRVSKQNSVIRIFISGEITQHSSLSAPDEYTLKVQPFSLRRGGFALDREETLLLKRTKGRGRRITLHGGQFEIITEIAASSRSPSRGANQRSGEINKETSALSVLRRIGDRTDTKQVSELADVFEGLRLFDPNVERARLPSSFAADESKHLRPDASNLAGVLRTLHEESPDLFKALEEDIRVVLPGFKEFKIEELAGGSSVAISLVEQGLRGSTPLSRASFGTVRAIALFAMLRDPEPPRLTCLEEVDHGLHPYALDVLVDRVREASTKGQIIIATHSPALVNRLDANELIIFERTATGSSAVFQLDSEQIDQMKSASGFELGELWFSGLLSGQFGE